MGQVQQETEHSVLQHGLLWTLLIRLHLSRSKLSLQGSQQKGQLGVQSVVSTIS